MDLCSYRPVLEDVPEAFGKVLGEDGIPVEADVVFGRWLLSQFFIAFTCAWRFVKSRLNAPPALGFAPACLLKLPKLDELGR